MIGQHKGTIAIGKEKSHLPYLDESVESEDGNVAVPLRGVPGKTKHLQRQHRHNVQQEVWREQVVPQYDPRLSQNTCK